MSDGAIQVGDHVASEHHEGVVQSLTTRARFGSTRRDVRQAVLEDATGYRHRVDVTLLSRIPSAEEVRRRRDEIKAGWSAAVRAQRRECDPLDALLAHEENVTTSDAA